MLVKIQKPQILVSSLFLNPRVRTFLRKVIAFSARSSLISKMIYLLAEKITSQQINISTVAIEDLDQILQEYDSFESFRKNPEAINLYFEKLQKYFGAERMHRKSFDSILAQVDNICVQIPEFSNRIWRNSSQIEPFQVDIPTQSRGRKINLFAWKLYRFQWLSQLRELAGIRSGPFHDVDMVEMQKSTNEFVIQLKKREEDFRFSLTASREKNKLNRKETRMAEASFYSAQLQNILLKKYAAFLVYKKMISSENQKFFQFYQADQILDYFTEEKDHFKNVLKKQLNRSHIPSSLVTACRDLFPKSSELMKKTDLFPLETIKTKNGKTVAAGSIAKSNLISKSVQTFHSLWLGIVENDCLAGDPANLDILDPKRWSIGVFKNVLTLVIEKNGRYSGFVRLVPCFDHQGQNFASLEIWSAILGKKIYLNNAKHLHSEINTEKYIFDIWISQLLQNLNLKKYQIVLSDSIEIDNLGIKETLLKSKAWKNGKKIYLSSNLNILDPLAIQIEKLTLNKKHRFGSRLIFDAQMLDSKEIKVIGNDFINYDFQKEL